VGRSSRPAASLDWELDLLDHLAAELVRTSWVALQGAEESVVHGDVGAGNVLIGPETVALLDWDESRVDSPWFDPAPLPADVPVPWPGDREVLVTARLAWEAATCWVEPDYAATVLSRLRHRVGGR
jgi:aminoglycoside phosphotransferase (APT) family kinase protein